MIKKITDENGAAVLSEADGSAAPDDMSVYDKIDGDNKKNRLKLPLVSRIFYVSAGVSLIIYIIALLSKDFSDFFCRYVASGPRAVMAWLTSWIPFSLGEAFVLLIPLIVTYFLVYSCRYASSTWHDSFVCCGILFSVIALMFTLFVFTLGTGYRGHTLDEKLELDRKNCSAEDLYETALILREKVNEEAGKLNIRPDGSSVMPYNYEDMSKKLMEAYDKAYDKYPFIQRLHSKAKPVMLSEPWTYTHITGVYTFFTGESNININMPDYTVPYTAAHEFAHQRGIAREDEANFVAFLVCIGSDDPYIRYSGYLSMYEYVADSLYGADYDLWLSARSGLSQNALKEMASYSSFFSKYRKNIVATVSGKVNDTFLKAQGTKGEVSYGLVVDLAVAYYKAQ